MSYLIGPQPLENFDYFRPVEARFRANEAINKAVSSASSTIVSMHDAKVNRLVSKYAGEYKLLIAKWMEENAHNAGSDFSTRFNTYAESIRIKHEDAIPSDVAKKKYALDIQSFHDSRDIEAAGISARARSQETVDGFERGYNNAYMTLTYSTGREVSTFLDLHGSLMRDIEFSFRNGEVSPDNYKEAKERVDGLAFDTANLLLYSKNDPETALDMANTFREFMSPDQYMKIASSAKEAIEYVSPKRQKQIRDNLMDIARSVRNTGITDEKMQLLAQQYGATIEDADARPQAVKEFLDILNTNRKLYVMEGSLSGATMSNLVASKQMLEEDYRSGRISEYGYKEMSKFMLDKIHLLSTDMAAYVDSTPQVQSAKDQGSRVFPALIRQMVIEGEDTATSTEFQKAKAQFQGNIFKERFERLQQIGKDRESMHLLTNIEASTFLANYNSATTDHKVQMVYGLAREAGEYGSTIFRQILRDSDNPSLRFAIDSMDLVVSEDDSSPHIPRVQQKILDIVQKPVVKNDQATYAETEKDVLSSKEYNNMLLSLSTRGQAGEYSNMINDYSTVATKTAMAYMNQGMNRKDAVKTAIADTISANYGFIETDNSTIMIPRRTRSTDFVIDNRSNERIATIGKALNIIDLPVDVVSKSDLLMEKDPRIAKEYGTSDAVTKAIDEELIGYLSNTVWERTTNDEGEDELTLFYTNGNTIETEVFGINQKKISIPIDMLERIIIEADAVSQEDVIIKSVGGMMGSSMSSIVPQRDIKRTINVPIRGRMTREEYINMRFLEYIGIDYEPEVKNNMLDILEMGKGRATGM